MFLCLEGLYRSKAFAERDKQLRAREMLEAARMQELAEELVANSSSPMVDIAASVQRCINQVSSGQILPARESLEHSWKLAQDNELTRNYRYTSLLQTMAAASVQSHEEAFVLCEMIAVLSAECTDSAQCS